MDKPVCTHANRKPIMTGFDRSQVCAICGRRWARNTVEDEWKELPKQKREEVPGLDDSPVMKKLRERMEKIHVSG